MSGGLEDWCERWRARLARGEDSSASPLPYDSAWWDSWEEAVRRAPSVKDGRGLPEKEARKPPLPLGEG